MERSQIILNYWFEEITNEKGIDKKSAMVKRWFSKSKAVDEEIRERFEADLKKAVGGEYRAWEKTPQGRLALVILFDQFSRNIYRNTPQMFATDPLALDVTLRSIKEGMDRQLQCVERIFFYMPLEHSERLEDQELSVEYCRKLLNDVEDRYPAHRAYFESTLDYAQRHLAIIQRFGRFPHRNAILSRESTSEEMEFLQKQGSRF